MDRRYKKKMDRYWYEMRKRALDSLSYVDPEDWFDYWHCHIDWYGKGDKRPENREAAMVLGYEVLNLATHLKARAHGPVQCWWHISEHSVEDAVYLHSPNENNTPFPHEFPDVTWDTTDNPFLSTLVDHATFRIGKLVNEDGTLYVVASKD